MPQTSAKLLIDASLERVFSAIAEIKNLPEAHPDVIHIEFLSEQKSGLGTRFCETRKMGKKEMKTELEVTEFKANQQLRMVTDSNGTVWDSLFTVRAQTKGVELSIVMDARAHQLLPRLLNPLMMGIYRKGLVRHLEALKNYCEG